MKRAGQLTAFVNRHKVETVITVAFLVVAAVITVVGTSGGTAAQRQQAHAFSLAALGKPGQRVSLGQYRGKPLIVNFWASWCAPCKQETPLLASFYRTHRGKVTVVGVDENDSEAHALTFARAKGVTYPLAFDPRVTMAGNYSLNGIPQTLFLDARHRIVDRIFGPVTLADLTKGVALMNGNG